MFEQLPDFLYNWRITIFSLLSVDLCFVVLESSFKITKLLWVLLQRYYTRFSSNELKDKIFKVEIDLQMKLINSNHFLVFS